MKDIVFLVVAGAALIGAIITAFSRSMIHAAIGLLFSLVGVAGVYVFLSADFLAISQILIYIGGVMVLIIFGIMLTSGGGNIFSNNPILRGIPAGLVTLGFLGVFGYVLYVTQLNLAPGKYFSTTREIGHLLLRDYILPFELVSVLIVVLIVGAGVILRKEMFIKKEIKEKEEK